MAWSRLAWTRLAWTSYGLDTYGLETYGLETYSIVGTCSGQRMVILFCGPSINPVGWNPHCVACTANSTTLHCSVKTPSRSCSCVRMHENHTPFMVNTTCTKHIHVNMWCIPYAQPAFLYDRDHIVAIHRVCKCNARSVAPQRIRTMCAL